MTAGDEAGPPPADELRPAVASGVRWAAVDQTVQVVVRMGTTVALARLLAPRDFGLFALAIVVVNLGNLIVGFGLSEALIQRSRLEDRHVVSSFTLSAASGVAVAVAVALGAPLIARVFRQDDLTPILFVIAGTFVLGGVERTPNDMLVRRLRMREYYLSSTAATVLGAVVALSAAAAGAGVWALVAMTVTEGVVATALAWGFAVRAGAWRPRLGVDRDAARDLASFGATVTGGRFLGFAQANLDNMIVGRYLGAAPLGVYAVAYRTVLLPITKMSEIMGATAFAAFAGVQHDLTRLRSGVRQANLYVAIVCLPVTTGMAITASIAVPLVFGERWATAGTVVALLALVGPAISFTRLDDSLYRAVGRPGLALKLGAADVAAALPATIIGARWGVEGVAVGVVVSSYVALPLVLSVRARILEQRLRDQVAPIVPIVAATAFMAAGAWLTRRLLEARVGAIPTLAGTAGAGAALYAGAIARLAPATASAAYHDLRRR